MVDSVTEELPRFLLWAESNLSAVKSIDIQNGRLTYTSPATDSDVIVRFAAEGWKSAWGLLNMRPPESYDRKYELIAMWLDESVATMEPVPTSVTIRRGHFQRVE